MLWPIITILCSAAAVAVSIPLIRRYESSAQTAARGLEIYKDQIKEVETDLSVGTISTVDAEQAKTEIQRRLVSASRSVEQVRPLTPAWRGLALASTAGLVILGSVNLYGYLGSPDLPTAPVRQIAVAAPDATAQQPAAALPQAAQIPAAETPAAPAANGTGQVSDMIQKLALRLQANPKDAEGWRMLGWSYFNIQNYDQSVAAYAKAVALDGNNIEYKSAYAEALVQSTQGMVTPEAQKLIADVLAKDPKDLRGRFYDALAREQAGDQAGALDRWMALLAEAPADAGWREDVRVHIEKLGKDMGRDVSAAVANAASPPAAAAQPLAADEKNAMVDGMIAKLAQKLVDNPKDRDGWAMMIRSLTVRGDKAGADKALADALVIFKDDPATIEGLKNIATSAAFQAQAAANAKAGTTGAVVPPGAVAPDLNTVDQNQKAAIEAAAPDDQQAMIKGMVAKLAARLDASPNDSEGWIRLMRAYMVLNDPTSAKGALDKALVTFASDATAKQTLQAAATELGIK
jgi:cytochrome c-type biogenesis protein CcmH